MTAASHRSIDLDRAVQALANALDLVGVDKPGHGHRVALMAAGCAIELGWPEPRRHDLLRAALLHDCGVSSTREHRTLVNVLHWDDARRHAERGAVYLSEVPALAHLAPIVAEHHTPWSELQARGVEPEIAEAANLIFLADRADAARAIAVPPGREVAEALARHDDGHFSPQLMAAFTELSEREAFWFAQEEPWLHVRVNELLADGPRVRMDWAAIKGLARVFARIIDAKSPYTERHSQGVARLVRRIGERFGLEPAVLDELEVAGLLHDLGKLGIPDELLEKAGPLGVEERRMMARHAFDTYEILRHVFGSSPIAQWAALHHEHLSGHGYPFHSHGDQLPLQARIVAVADVFQALAQKRPYRDGLDGEAIAHHLDGMVFAGRLDRSVVDVVKADMEGCRGVALAGEG